MSTSTQHEVNAAAANNQTVNQAIHSNDSSSHPINSHNEQISDHSSCNSNDISTPSSPSDVPSDVELSSKSDSTIRPMNGTDVGTSSLSDEANDSEEEEDAKKGSNKMSCHQCKTTKEQHSLVFCTVKAEKGTRKRKCRKKYCDACLKRSYGIEANTLTSKQLIDWVCPSCEGTCTCAACQRKLVEQIVRKQQRKLLEARKAAGLRAAEQSQPATATVIPGRTNGIPIPAIPSVPVASLASSSNGFNQPPFPIKAATVSSNGIPYSTPVNAYNGNLMNGNMYSSNFHPSYPYNTHAPAPAPAPASNSFNSFNGLQMSEAHQRQRSYEDMYSSHNGVLNKSVLSRDPCISSPPPTNGSPILPISAPRNISYSVPATTRSLQHPTHPRSSSMLQHSVFNRMMRTHESHSDPTSLTTTPTNHVYEEMLNKMSINNNYQSPYQNHFSSDLPSPGQPSTVHGSASYPHHVTPYGVSLLDGYSKEPDALIPPLQSVSTPFQHSHMQSSAPMNRYGSGVSSQYPSDSSFEGEPLMSGHYTALEVAYLMQKRQAEETALLQRHQLQQLQMLHAHQQQQLAIEQTRLQQFTNNGKHDLNMNINCKMNMNEMEDSDKYRASDSNGTFSVAGAMGEIGAAHGTSANASTNSSPHVYNRHLANSNTNFNSDSSPSTNDNGSMFAAMATNNDPYMQRLLEMYSASSSMFNPNYSNSAFSTTSSQPTFSRPLGTVQSNMNGFTHHMDETDH